MTRHTVNLIDVGFDGDTEVRGTERHPVWSEDRQDWVGLGERTLSEVVRCREGDVRVRSVRPVATPQQVFNIETNREHVYEITQAGILVHNADPDCERYQELLARSKNGLTDDEKKEFDELYTKLSKPKLRVFEGKVPVMDSSEVKERLGNTSCD